MKFKIITAPETYEEAKNINKTGKQVIDLIYFFTNFKDII